MNTLRLLAVGTMVCLIGAGARAEEKVNYAKMLVGKWEVVKADPGTVPPGSLITFTKDRKIQVTGKKDDKEVTMEGTYTVEGDKFTFVFKQGDMEHKDTITITKISKTDMATKNTSGKTVELKRKK